MYTQSFALQTTETRYSIGYGPRPVLIYSARTRENPLLTMSVTATSISDTLPFSV